MTPPAVTNLSDNTSPFNAPLNAYPSDELLDALKAEWGRFEHIPAPCVYFCGGGTEQAVDLTLRAFCTAGRDSIVAPSPTRTIYERRARVCQLDYREAPLGANDFELSTEAVLNCVGPTTRAIILCSPNSPTGNLLDPSAVETILALFTEGLVLVDESYIEFAPGRSVLPLLNRFKNLVVLRSFSHAWSAAGLRLAAVVAHPEVIARYAAVGPTHPVSLPVITAARTLVRQRLDVDKWVRRIVEERDKVRLALSDLPECRHIYASAANFLFVRFDCSEAVHRYLAECGIRTSLHGDCLRITIGSAADNTALLSALRKRI